MSSSLHTREVPAEWPGLLSFTETLVEGDPNIPIKWRSGRRLIRKIGELTNEQRETNYDYAAGQIICGMSVALKDKAKRQNLINTSALGFFMNAVSERLPEIPPRKSFVPKVKEIRPGFSHEPFKQVALEAWQALPPAERVLSDALTFATFYKRAAAVTKINPLAKLFYTIIGPKRVSQGRLAAGRVADETLSGVTAVTQILLANHNPETKPSQETLDGFVSKERFDQAWDPATATRAARFRLDEFTAGQGWHTVGNKVTVNPSFFKTPPTPLNECPRAAQLHEERLMCPAVQADGFAAQMAYDIFPEIMREAYGIVPVDLINRRSR